MGRPPPEVHAHADLLGYLTSWFDYRRALDSAYSYRDFADEVGEQNRTILHAILRGEGKNRRRCTPDMLERWLPVLVGPSDLRGPDAELLRAMAAAEEARWQLDRRERWAERQETADAARQASLAKLRFEQARARVEGLRAAALGRQVALERPDAAELCCVGLDGPPRHPDQLVDWLVRGQEALLGVAPPKGLERAVHALTEATGPALRAELVSRIASARDALLTLSVGGPVRFHVQVSMFPLSRCARSADNVQGAPTGAAPVSAQVDAPDVFEWGDGSDGDEGAVGFLRAWLAWRRAEDPTYSLQDFSDETLQPDRTLLWKLIERRWRLTPMRAIQLARGDESPRHPGMGLTEDEASYLALLAERDAASGATRARAQRQLDDARAMATRRRLTRGQVHGWDDPVPWALLELRWLAAWRADSAWVAEILWPPEDPARVARVLQEAEARGLEGAIARELELTERSGDPVTSPVTRYHRQMKARAVAAFGDATANVPEPRVAFALTLAVHPEALQALHLRLEAIVRELQELCGGSKEPRDQVLQINLHGWTL